MLTSKLVIGLVYLHSVIRSCSFPTSACSSSLVSSCGSLTFLGLNWMRYLRDGSTRWMLCRPIDLQMDTAFVDQAVEKFSLGPISIIKFDLPWDPSSAKRNDLQLTFSLSNEQLKSQTNLSRSAWSSLAPSCRLTLKHNSDDSCVISKRETADSSLETVVSSPPGEIPGIR